MNAAQTSAIVTLLLEWDPTDLSAKPWLDAMRESMSGAAAQYRYVLRLPSKGFGSVVAV